MPPLSTAPQERPVPSARQLAWHRLGFYGFIHFTTNTFTGREWGYGDESPSLFNPDKLDARQWARVAKEAGMQGLILTCKHHDGFCLWPSAYTGHSVKNAPWKYGKGDVVRECSDACREFGLKFGVYLSPWDRNHPDYGKPAYVEYYRNQLRELLGNYGPVFEIWLDGANGGDGYYGGANEVRKIDRATYYEWPETIGLVRQMQPEAVIFSDGGPDVRWVGNECGEAALTNWATLNAEGRYPGYSPEGYHSRLDLGEGHEGGTHWLPAEVDVSIRPGWFYHPEENDKARTPANLLELYLQSVGRGANLLLNLPPDRRGLLPDKDVENLLAFARLRDRLFAAPAAVLSVSGDAGTLPMARTETGRCFELPFLEPKQVSFAELREPIWFGQRVKEWTLEALCNDQWQSVAAGTTIGYRRLVRFAAVRAEGLRLRVKAALAPALLCHFGAYDAPEVARDPEIRRDAQGRIHLSAGAEGMRIRYTLDGKEPGPDSAVYAKPLDLPEGGLIRAAVRAEDNPQALCEGKQCVSREFGLPKHGWRILSCSSENAAAGESAANLRNDDPASLWSTHPTAILPEGEYPFVAIDLGGETEIAAFAYLPRQLGHQDIVNRCAFCVSSDGVVWTTAAEAVFDNIAANPIAQKIALPKPLRARYFRFTALSTTDGGSGASAAGLEVFPARSR